MINAKCIGKNIDYILFFLIGTAHTARLFFLNECPGLSVASAEQFHIAAFSASSSVPMDAGRLPSKLLCI